MMATDRKTSKLVPTLVSLLFLGPVALAVTMYFFGGDDWRPRQSTAHGTLFENPATLPQGLIVLSGLTRTDDGTLEFGGKWTLLQVGRGDCGDDCREMLYRTRQVRRALGRDMSRVQRVFVVTAGSPDATFLAAEHPGLAVLGEDMAVRNSVLASLGDFADGDIFIADPIGNVVMKFPAGSEMKDMHKDLALLLKASQIG